ncbi:Mannan endo-1,4-beta-mannosidase protein [Dioscorea alata]|uniref:Mannan endo-1,4-beta-mannosidase protein n=3 Tax=Dioscorea alata TaxID=55571 RepID=A0ACB7U1B6_DIOAL|nr:Mannan endo-1,4-beta-mannosidase protein [Dioscorea alata]
MPMSSFMCCCMNMLSCFSNSKGRNRTHAMEIMEEKEWGMVGKRGNQFVVEDKPFFINGFNTYWLMVLSAYERKKEVTKVLHQASSVGLNVCRTWAFYDAGSRALQITPGVYNEKVFEGLDFVLSEAKRFGIRLILSFVDNWNAFGGKPQYVKWARDAGLSITCDDDFFSDPTIKGYYKAHVKTVLTRVNTITNVMYKDDPTIFAWELINEPRCPSDPSGDKLQAWIEEMASYVKSIDPVHLLEIGEEGFYGYSTPDKMFLNPNRCAGEGGTDFIRNHQALGIDFASVHMYPDSWIKQPDSKARLNFGRTWMQSHIDDADKVLGMPVVFGEYGVSRKHEGFSFSFRDTFINMVHQTLLRSTKKGGSGAGSLLWQLFTEGTENMDDGYAVNLAEAPSVSHMLALQSMRLKYLVGKSSRKWLWSGKNKNLLN